MICFASYLRHTPRPLGEGGQSVLIFFFCDTPPFAELPGWIQLRGIVYCPMNPSPIKSSSCTTNRTRARSGRLMWNSKVSSKTGLKPTKKRTEKGSLINSVECAQQTQITSRKTFTIVRNRSCSFLWNVSWNAKHFDCDERIDHLHKITVNKTSVHGRRISKYVLSNNYGHTYVTLSCGTLWLGKLLTANDLREKGIPWRNLNLCMWLEK